MASNTSFGGKYSSFLGSTIIVTLSDGNAARTPRLPPGRYVVYGNEANFHARQGGVGVNATTNDILIEGGAYVNDLLVTGNNDEYISFIRASATTINVRVTRTDQTT